MPVGLGQGEVDPMAWGECRETNFFELSDRNTKCIFSARYLNLILVKSILSSLWMNETGFGECWISLHHSNPWKKDASLSGHFSWLWGVFRDYLFSQLQGPWLQALKINWFENSTFTWRVTIKNHCADICFVWLNCMCKIWEKSKVPSHPSGLGLEQEGEETG